MQLDGLAAWMDGQGLGSGPITSVERLGGGAQNILLRFDRAGRGHVLRRAPQALRAGSNEIMLREGGYARGCAGLAPADVGERLHARSAKLFELAIKWIGQ